MSLTEQIQQKIDLKTKPIGALGQLEQLAWQIANYQKTLSPSLKRPAVLVFAGDHGIAQRSVSAYPPEVTYQMVLNFAQGGAAINVFTRQHNIELSVIDTGVNGDFAHDSAVLDYKVAPATLDFSKAKAMTKAQYEQCVLQGRALVTEQAKKGTNIIGFGEMGIGNTASASMIMHSITHLPLAQCVGRGTGLDDNQYQHKINILTQAAQKHGQIDSIAQILQTYAGFEIVHIYAAMQAAYEQGMLFLVDGFIASSAYLAAHAINSDIKNAAIFCHQSDESGHLHLLNYLQAQPILKMQLRLGEGSGCALAYPLIQSAIDFFNDMASFDSAGVSNKDVADDK